MNKEIQISKINPVSQIMSAEELRECLAGEWPSVEEQEAHWSLRDEGRSDGAGESYAERNV
jgi:hypothetical protein